MDGVKEILCQQLQLLAEESKNAKLNDRGYKSGLIEYSDAICRISETYAKISGIQPNTRGGI